jgi:hypothetical protein
MVCEGEKERKERRMREGEKESVCEWIITQK